MSNRTAGLFTLALFAVASVVSIGCSSSVGPQGSMPLVSTQGGAPKHHRRHPAAYGDAISHIFIIIQENRSLNNIFAGANIAGANTTTTGEERVNSNVDVQVQLSPEPLKTALDIDHCYYDAVTAIDGPEKPMDDFNNETLLPNGSEICGKGPTQAGTVPYAYVRQQDAQPYWDIANSWVLGANFYPTELGPSFVAHLNILAGTTEVTPKNAIADYPDGAWGCEAQKSVGDRHLTPSATPNPYTSPYPCFNQFHTIADLLDGIYSSPSPSPIPWRYYAPSINSPSSYIWSAFRAIKRVRDGPDWTTDIVTPPPQIFSDIKNGNLNKVGVTWIVPEAAYSDHAGNDTDAGPSWVADITNAIGASNLWSSSVIVVIWDDWGGWYDNAPPPNLDFRGYGIRTPMLILSPYAMKNQNVAGGTGTVSTVQFEPGSILKFIEQVFGLPYLSTLPCNYNYYNYYSCNVGYTDKTANSIGSVLNITQSPRPYGTPIPTKYPPSHFEKGGSGYYLSSNIPPDDE